MQTKPCGTCGGTERYAGSGCCVPCAKRRSTESKRRNPENSNAYSRKWNRANPDRVLANHRASRGLPTPTRPEPAACEACGAQPRKRLNLDHDHGTGMFRGWLCWGCNVALGKLGDSIAAARQRLNNYERCVNAN